MNEVIWSGKGSLPGMSGEGWVQRGASLLTAYALETGDVRYEQRKVSGTLVCACGKRKRADYPSCAACLSGATPRVTTRRCTGCKVAGPVSEMKHRQEQWWCVPCAPAAKNKGGRPKAKQRKGGA